MKANPNKMNRLALHRISELAKRVVKLEEQMLRLKYFEETQSEGMQISPGLTFTGPLAPSSTLISSPAPRIKFPDINYKPKKEEQNES